MRLIKKFIIGIFVLATGYLLLGTGLAQDYILFYGNGCPHCAQVEQYIKDNDIQKDFDLVLKEIYFNRSNLTELQGYLEKLQLDVNQIGVPFLVINSPNECSYINGSTPIIDFFEAKLDMIAVSEDEEAECNTETCQGLQCESQTLEDVQNTTNGNAWIQPPSVEDKIEPIQETIIEDEKAVDTILTGDIEDIKISGAAIEEEHFGFFGKRSFFGIMMPAALSDSINPCAFAVMLLLLSTILSRHQSRKKTLLSGGLFVLAVFISYLAMGIGLFSALATANNTFILKLVVGIIGILVGLANIKDFFRYGKVFVMEVPFSRRPKLQDLIHKISSPRGAFFIGLLVSLFLLPCSSGPYFTILGYMSSQSKDLNTRGYIYLIIYNLVFVLPMLAIAFLVSFGRTSVDKLAKIKQEKTKLIHLIVGLLMLGLGIYVLTTI